MHCGPQRRAQISGVTTASLQHEVCCLTKGNLSADVKAQLSSCFQRDKDRSG